MRNLLILTFDNFRNSFRTKRALIFLVLYLGVFGLITFGFIKANQEIERQVQIEVERQLEVRGVDSSTRKLAVGMSTKMAENFAREFLKTKNNEVINFLLDTPFLNIMLFLVSLFGTPLLILILKYDTLTQEIYDGTLRFLLFRSSRKSIFFAKFFSGLIEFASLTLIAFLIAYVWIGLGFDKWMDFSTGLKFWLLSQIFMSVFVAFYLFISTLFQKPFYSLLTACLGSLLLMLIPWKIPYLSPFDPDYLKGFFYSYSASEFQIMLLGYLALTVIFLSAGYLVFKKKPL